MALFPKSSSKRDVRASRTPFPAPPKTGLLQSTLFRVVDALSGRFSSSDITPLTGDFLSASNKLLSDTDRTTIVDTMLRSKTPVQQRGMSFSEYLRTTSKNVAQIRIENERIRNMSPEISQAASMMVPAILAPNDLRDSAIAITCKAPTLTTKQQKDIAEKLTEWFDTNMNLSVNLAKWIDEALYGAGSKPLLVIPVTAFEQSIKSPGTIVESSLESYNRDIQDASTGTSYFGISSHFEAAKTNTLQHVLSATESLAAGTLSEIVKSNLSPTERKSYHHQEESFSTDQRRAYEEFVKSVISNESLSIIDNPLAINANYIRNNKATAKISTAVEDFSSIKPKSTKPNTPVNFTQSDIVIFDTPDPNKKQVDNAIFLPLPSESVIPLYTPGTPDDHIGYFIIIDETGGPINIADYEKESLHAAADTPNQSEFTQLFQAYGFQNQYPLDTGKATMANLYQNIVESHLKSVTANAGFANVGIGSNASVYRCMLMRYLQKRMTQLVFVPKEMLTYFTFKYAPDGTGVSKLEEVKYILALRTSLVTCRLLSAFNNAIDRRKINVTYDSDFVGDVLENMRTIQREAIRKSAVTFTHDPMNIAQQVADKSYTIAAQGIPGMPQFTIENAPNERGSVTIDTDLSEDLRNLLILSLDVPPSALNNLSQDEYSRSILTTNIFFSRKCVERQKTVVMHASKFVQSVVRFSEELIDLVMNCAGDASDETMEQITPPQSDGTINTNTITSQKFHEDILPYIKIFLPPPSIAANTTQFENVNNFLTNVDGVLAGILPDELGDNDQAKAVLGQIRAARKSALLTNFMQEIGFTDFKFPSLDDLPYDMLIPLKRTLFNIEKAIKAQNVFDVSKASDQDGGAGGGFGGDSGGFGDGGGGDDGMGGFGDDSSDAGQAPEDGGDFGSATPDDEFDNGNASDSTGDTTPEPGDETDTAPQESGAPPDDDNVGL